MKGHLQALIMHRFVRHPSYLGWFVWSVGTQVLLSNPLCFLLYIFASWNFFRTRIEYEEMLLLRFFPTEYPAYKAKTWSGVPFTS